MFNPDLLALQTVVPLVSAAICAFLPSTRWSWFLATIICLLLVVNAAIMLNHVLDAGDVYYAMGNWSAPFGIE